MRPVDGEADIANIQNLDYKALRKSFRKQHSFLVQRILKQMRPLTINDVAITPAVYLQLLQMYLKKVNENGIPQILTSLEM